MKSSSRYCAFLVLTCLLPIAAVPATVQKSDIVVGVNFALAGRFSTAQQDAILGQMKAAGVRVIRTGISADEAGIDFVRRVYAHDIQIEWNMGFYDAYQPNAPWIRHAHPLSYADPDRFRAALAPLFAKLDEAGITLAGLELANEINSPGFNADFPNSGEGKNFGFNDLLHDPEAQQIAKGYLQYVKMLTVVKDLRDHSKLNRRAPIVSAGLVAYEAPEGVIPNNPKKGDMVSASATIDFMRTHGLDQLVDAYGIHTYPWNNGPGNPDATRGRQNRLKWWVLNECKPVGSKDGKPCWITEWGFFNPDMKCPVDDTKRATLVREMMGDLRPYVQQGRLTGLFYYAWNADPWQKTPDVLTIYRCGALTESGRLALDASMLH